MSEKIRSYLGNGLLKFNGWMERKPVVVSLILGANSLVFSLFLVFLGDVCSLTKDVEGKVRLTVLGWGLVIVSVVLTFLVEAAKGYALYIKQNATVADSKDYIYICNRVNSSIVKVCNAKYNTLMKLISDVAKGKVSPMMIISRPSEQLKTITSELERCLRDLLEHDGYKLGDGELYVSLFYKCDSTKEWKQAESPFPEKGLALQDLVNNDKSTFSRVCHARDNIVFINDKEKGRKEGNYVPDDADKYDEEGNLKGSILCYRTMCQQGGKTYIEAVIAISTYNKRMEPSNDKERIKNTKDNILKYIIEPFKERISIELCLSYLSSLYDASRENINDTNDSESQ